MAKTISPRNSPLTLEELQLTPPILEKNMNLSDRQKFHQLNPVFNYGKNYINYRLIMISANCTIMVCIGRRMIWCGHMQRGYH